MLISTGKLSSINRTTSHASALAIAQRFGKARRWVCLGISDWSPSTDEANNKITFNSDRQRHPTFADELAEMVRNAKGDTHVGKMSHEMENYMSQFGKRVINPVTCIPYLTATPILIVGLTPRESNEFASSLHAKSSDWTIYADSRSNEPK